MQKSSNNSVGRIIVEDPIWGLFAKTFKSPNHRRKVMAQARNHTARYGGHITETK
jgi:hypothetical protein